MRRVFFDLALDARVGAASRTRPRSRIRRHFDRSSRRVGYPSAILPLSERIDFQKDGVGLRSLPLPDREADAITDRRVLARLILRGHGSSKPSRLRARR